MKTPTLPNVQITQFGYDSAILSVLPFPALVFDLTSLIVLKSNSFFCNEKDSNIIPILVKYDYAFLDDEDFRKIKSLLYANQNYVVHKLYETPAGIKTYEVHVYLLPDKKNAFLYFNLLSDHKLSDLNFEMLGGWGHAIGIVDSKFKILVNQLPLGVYRTDVNGNFIFVNPFLAKLLEFNSVEELYKINVSDIFVNPDDRTIQLEKWKKSIINSEEVELRTKTGRHLFVRDIGLSILNKKGSIEYFDGIIEDITDSVIMKEELTRTRDKALESDRLKTTFLTNMSHEIRTPMNSILGFSSMLKRKGIHHHRREQYLDIIISRGQHLMQILNDILDITRIEEDQIQTNSILFNLNQLLEDLYQNVDIELKASKKNIRLSLETPLAEEDSLIIADNHHLSKIFINLLNNSVKFTEEGLIEFGYKIDSEKYLTFYVKDTGMGISPELHETVFRRFRQGDESFTRIHGGLGLGLAICKGLTKLVGGKIWLESDGHSGSTFYFTISYSRHINEEHHIEHTSLIGNSLFWENKHVLIVEDDPGSFEYLNEILSLTGCNVLHASNGREAMEIYYKNHPIDLILLDIQLPEIDGYQLAQTIRVHNSHIPIIAQTAHALSEDKRKCIEAGCNSYITKPISYDMLIDTLKEFLS